jgi:hypothetical protein
MGDNNRRLVHVLHNIGDSEGLSGPGNAKKHLVLSASGETFGQFGYSPGLISLWGEFCPEFKFIH